MRETKTETKAGEKQKRGIGSRGGKTTEERERNRSRGGKTTEEREK
jgi:hypothetical protein